MKEQIVKLMEAEGLSPAKFADEIGVQRSSISHIISGRNKPSYDFIMKVMKRFSGLNSEWLLTGKGSMIKSSESIDNSTIQNKDLFNYDASRDEENLSEKGNLTSIDQKENNQVSGNTLSSSEITINSEDKRKVTNVNDVNYILVFYKDGSFRQYNPRERDI